MHPAALTFNVPVAPHRLSDARRTAGRTVCQAQNVEAQLDTAMLGTVFAAVIPAFNDLKRRRTW